MQKEPFYAAFPWPLNEIYKYWDTVFAHMITAHAEKGIEAWFWPYKMMADQVDISDFGTEQA